VYVQYDAPTGMTANKIKEIPVEIAPNVKIHWGETRLAMSPTTMLQVIPLILSRSPDQAKSHRFQVFQRWVLTLSDLAKNEAITKACSVYPSVLDHSQ
jgi:hypothetical protein